ncbi:hypothetical protein F1880_000152 [Penicillium rolfsii]|nr:hypothetical protein F1880_000152 [Penicillium rolfsii]
MSTFISLCGNWKPEQTACKQEGRYTCKNCFLVTVSSSTELFILYCGPTCQKSHWPLHKPECRMPLGKATWQPAWILENRKPVFMGDGPPVTFGQSKYLWGNVPAFDILRLGSNEGETYSGDLRILFAGLYSRIISSYSLLRADISSITASGDLRNVVKTVSHLPNSYNQSLEITMNDRDFDIVARNLILLLIALVVQNSDEAVDCIIHLWYSTLFVKKIKDKSPSTLLGKTWTFGTHTLRAIFEQSSWIRLLSFLDKPAGLTAEKAAKIRADNTLAHARRDYRDRYMIYLPSSQRVPFYKFRQDGLLFPFGFPRHEFKEPNPTFFQTNDTWPMMDNADPLHGWPLEEVLNTNSGAATADTYGKLFYYLRGLLRSFLDRVSNLKVSFKLLHLDAAVLSDDLDDNSFSRIDVSNISDRAWLGIHRTLAHMVPLLQNNEQNPHATLITLFMNAVEETMTTMNPEDGLQGLDPNSRASRDLLKYIPPKEKPRSIYDPSLIKFQHARELVAKYDHVFERFLEQFKVRETGDFVGAAMKEKHSILEKWPYRLKLRPGQPGAQEEFDRRLRDGVSGKERYIEWKRVHQGMI